MTRENARKAAELYAAFADEKTIQYKCVNGQWHDAMESELNFISDPNLWRIKPPPKEAWLIYEWEGDSFPLVRTDKSAAESCLSARIGTHSNAFIVHMIEKTQ